MEDACEDFLGILEGDGVVPVLGVVGDVDVECEDIGGLQVFGIDGFSHWVSDCDGVGVAEGTEVDGQCGAAVLGRDSIFRDAICLSLRTFGLCLHHMGEVNSFLAFGIFFVDVPVGVLVDDFIAYGTNHESVLGICQIAIIDILDRCSIATNTLHPCVGQFV